VIPFAVISKPRSVYSVAIKTLNTERMERLRDLSVESLDLEWRRPYRAVCASKRLIARHREFVIVAGQNPIAKAQQSGPVEAKLCAVVRDHGRHSFFFLPLATEQRVARNDGDVFACAYDQGQVAGNVARGDEALDAFRQGMGLNPPELLRRARRFTSHHRSASFRRFAM